MPNPKAHARPAFISALLEPIQEILSDLLTTQMLAGKPSKTMRKALAETAGEALVRQYPLTRLIAPVTRERILGAQLDLLLDLILFNEDLPETSAGSGFEGLILETQPNSTGQPASQLAQSAILTVLGPGWTLTRLPLNERSFLATSEDMALSVPQAWSAAHSLKAISGIAHAEPNFIVPLENHIPDEAMTVAAGFMSGGDKHLPITDTDNDWSLKAIRATEAWALPALESGATQGEGIVIGHPDTGYTRHPENWIDDPARNKILFKLGFDFWKNDADATDDLESGRFCGGLAPCNPGHGTGTSSVIFSDQGSPTGAPHWVSGVAPRVKLVPLRVTPTVVLWDQRRLADAIIRATDIGCHVLSISLGGIPSNYLLGAIQRSVGSGVIVCCAAGNIFGASNVLPAVVWPAAYDEVIAVAATNADDKTWKGSSRGRQVDISAPGESVWHASAGVDIPPGAVDRGNGTSFAVAHVAGVAALWLAYHGRERLIARYGASHLAPLFRTLLVSVGFKRPAGWNTTLFGAGIVDAVKMLKAPLPAAGGVHGLSAQVELTRAPRKQMAFDQLANLFDDVPRDELRRQLARLLHTGEALLAQRLEEVGDELVFHFFSDTQARNDFRASLKTALPTALAAPPLNAPERLLQAASPHLAAYLT